MYLVDTNIWLERLLSQAREAEVKRFLAETPSEELAITDFAFHSVGVILTKLDHQVVFAQFTQDLFIDGNVNLISLEPSDVTLLLEVAAAYNLDFDDAYQYCAAEKNHLQLGCRSAKQKERWQLRGPYRFGWCRPTLRSPSVLPSR